MAEEQPPLLLCMENMNGEEVTLAISPSDDFNAFLAKAKVILGFDVDLNSVTKNHPVKLTDNIYQFLIQNEAKSDQDAPSQTLEEILEQSSTDLVYVLDDGTQINASQIHFDNDDPFTDLTKETLPFVRYNDCVDDENKVVDEDTVKKINIVASPVVKNPSFVNNIPFKLICSSASGFEAQFVKHLQGKTYTQLNTVVTKKSPKTLIKDNYKKYIQEVKKNEAIKPFSRDDVVNMLKDSPVVIPNNPKEKRRHIRKTNPAPVYKKAHKYIDLPYFPIGNLENQDCFICLKYVDNTMERLYIFDKEDQKLHKSSPQKRRSTQLKILCESCLYANFQQCPMVTQNRQLNFDEYLIIRNNQQFIYRLTNPNCFRKASLPVLPEMTVVAIPKEPLKETIKETEAVIKEEQIIDIEIIDQGQDIDEVIENLEEADEDVKVFLGKYQKSVDKELVCRFCQQQFTGIEQVMDHGSVHKHNLDDGEVYPCPLCDYGYADSKWLRGHLKAAHEKSEKNLETEINADDNSDVANSDNPEVSQENDKNIDTSPDTTASVTRTKPLSPIAKRTRSSNKKKDNNNNDSSETETQDKSQENKENIDSNIGKSTTETDSHVISTEVKQECLDSDDGIWIVQTDDSDLEHETKDSLKHKKVDPFNHKCLNCNKLFANAEALTLHKCVKSRGRKRKSINEDEDIICIPSQEDFLKRAKGRNKKQKDEEDPDNEAKKDKYKTTINHNIVTCNDCNENFSSKVRLKFHMQFHDKSDLLTPSGQYRCATCPSTFPAERALFDHVHFRHPARRRWQCPLPACRKTFRLRGTLTKHSRIHTDTRRYVCPTCGKRFLDKQTLDEHGVTHLQTKPFQCHICMKQLTRRSRLRMHLRAHEVLTPRDLLVCVHCHRAFRDEREAEEHAQTSSSCLYEAASELKLAEQVHLSPSSGLLTRTSSPTPPRLSARAVPRQASPRRSARLLRALPDAARALTRVALADRAFRCEFCEDVFYSEEGLNKHRAIHKGVKNPFTCHICKVAFATYSRCTTHKTTHGFYKRPVGSPGGTKTDVAGQNILGYGDFPVAKHFLCEDCGRSYLHWTYLQVHRRMKHARDQPAHSCPACHLTFPNSWSVSYHRKKAHGKTGAEEAGAATKTPNPDYRIPCRDCDEILPNKTALYRHRNKEHSDLSLYEEKQESFWCGACAHGPAHGAHCRARAGHGAPKSSVTASLRNTRRVKPRTDTRQKPETVLVLEFSGLDPAPDEIMARLKEKNVDLNKIIDINKISIPKGVKSVIPTTERALTFISSNQKKGRKGQTVIDNENLSQTQPQPNPQNVEMLYQPIEVQTAATLQTDEQTDRQPDVKTEQAGYDEKEDHSDINMSPLLRAGATPALNSPLQFDESLL